MLTKVTISFLRVFCVSEDEWPLRWSHDLSKHTLASQTFVQAILDLSQTKLRPISRHLWDFSSISWSRMCKPFCIPCVHLRFLTIASPILSDSESLLVYYLALMTIYPIFWWFWFLISISTFFCHHYFPILWSWFWPWSRDWIVIGRNFASCTLKWSIIWSEYEAGNIYAYIGEGMQRLGKHSPWYVKSKEIPFSMNITARSVLTNANGFKYIFILNDTYLNKVWFRYQLHFMTLDCISISSCTYCMYTLKYTSFPDFVA